MKPAIKMQLGKNGLSENFMDSLKNAFKKRKKIKVKVLKSIASKEKVKEIADNMIDKLGKKYEYKVIGHTIKIKKH